MKVLKSKVWPRFDSYTAWIEWGSLVHSGKMCTSFPAVIASAQAILGRQVMPIPATAA